MDILSLVLSFFVASETKIPMNDKNIDLKKVL
jgi:hypothetical protein